MSTYNRLTKNPKTGEFENATWMDDYFGHHHYGVKFPDGTVVDPDKVELETMDTPMPDNTKKEERDDSLGESFCSKCGKVKGIITGICYCEVQSPQSPLSDDWEKEVEEMLFGIDKVDSKCPEGWWETSSGAQFGIKTLQEIKDFIRQQRTQAQRELAKQIRNKWSDILTENDKKCTNFASEDMFTYLDSLLSNNKE